MHQKFINPYVVEIGGRFQAHPDLLDAVPSFKSIRLYDGVLPLSVPASGFTSVGFEQRQNSELNPEWFVGTYLLSEDSTDGTTSSNITVKIVDTGSNRYLMDTRQHIRAIFGNGPFPGMLYEPLIIRPNSAIRVEFYKISGGAVNIRPYIEGWENKGKNRSLVTRLQTRAENVWPFWMAPDIDTISLTANQSVVYNSVNSSDTFQGMSIVGVSTGAFSLEILEASLTKLAISNGFAPSTGIMGTAFFPYIFDVPMLVPPGGIVRWRFTDLSAATNSIWISINGRKIRGDVKNALKLEKETRP